MSYPNDTANTTWLPERRRPWARILLAMLYGAVLMVAAVYETNAHRILDRAQALESQGKLATASLGYRLVIERYPFSFAVPPARRGFVVTEPASRDWMPSLDGLPEAVAEVVGPRSSPYLIDWFPLAGAALAGLVAFLAFLVTTGRSPGLAILCLLIMVATGALLVAQLGHHGFMTQFLPADLMDLLMEDVLRLYGGTWAFLLAVAGLTLIAARRPVQEV